MEREDLILQNILQYLDEGIHVIDKEGKTIIYNRSMEELEGIKRENIINNHLLDIFPSLDEESSTLFTVMKTGRAIMNRGQTYLNYKGKKISSVNTTIPIFDKGDLIGALEIGKDITKIKELSEELLALRSELNSNNNKKIKIKSKKYIFDNIIGKTDNLKKSIDIAKKASKSSSSVLIYGETGTGKELFAQSIHYSGIRKKSPFVAQNCAALPEQLLEGILFGTVKGGFTGAVDRPGLFEQANGGTLLLDEINSMGMLLQSKLLRVLQEGYIRRVGGTKEIPVDVRIIATTNELPNEAIDDRRLRRDLYYRLNVININIPPLRERKEDLNLLAEAFIRKYNKKLQKNVWMLSREVMSLFKVYNWPGNVRELENMIEGAMNFIAKDEHVLQIEYFPDSIKDFEKKKKTQNNILKINQKESLKDTLNNIEKEIIKSKLIECNNNISAAARNLGVKRQTLQHKLKKYELLQVQ
ncbi:sigma 54-interacting transcriptional regulator [Clostridium sp. D2Q-14]|uniref:sigma-54 interaction domain-containing protein n=1 Tax=Anaeromonas gelatinilytica TaxID=2683194 RepID=UPI00193B836D|nr:sigma 54-interacting transcriptional regulator [Anaeromonas gelatinilytica]MBS4535396.1 sigma 54-interacting transcriptional regulator [Anaeromonas gelatinilytica]